MEISTLDYSNHLEIYKKLTFPFLSSLNNDRLRNRNKIIELCHIGKFLLHFNQQYSIERLCESPDFILKSPKELIGIEHCTIVDQKSKEKEGFIGNVFAKAELEIQNDLSLPNFLANCYIRPYYNYKIKDKDKIVSKIVEIVKQYILNDVLIKNDIIERIWKMDHSHKNICPNLGAWWQKDITPELIFKWISKKEKLISKYQKNELSKIWLLMVIGGSGESSYRMKKDLNINLETQFDKIFILEDTANILYKLK